MIALFDTSVLVAAFQSRHEHHAPSLRAFSRATKETAVCAGHTLAELYSVATRLPRPYRVLPEHALVLVDQVCERTKIVTLDGEDYHAMIRRAATERQSGGRIYDALLLACARKAKAKKIYTWNTRHFREIAPDMAERIVEP